MDRTELGTIEGWDDELGDLDRTELGTIEGWDDEFGDLDGAFVIEGWEVSGDDGTDDGLVDTLGISVGWKTSANESRKDCWPLDAIEVGHFLGRGDIVCANKRGTPRRPP